MLKRLLKAPSAKATTHPKQTEHANALGPVLMRYLTKPAKRGGAMNGPITAVHAKRGMRNKSATHSI